MPRETGLWMPMYWADYVADTMHLTTEEHGAYLLLIAAYWRRGEALPDDDKFLAQVTRMTPKKWSKTKTVVQPFFELSGGVLIHKRLEKEILKSSSRLKSARAAGKAGGLAKSYLTTTTVTEVEERTAIAVPKNAGQGSDVDDIPDFMKAKNRGNGDAKRGTRLTADWRPTEQDCEYATNHGLDPGGIAEQFRDYWIAATGQKATKRDWAATWRTWCRREAERLANRPGSGGIVAGTLEDIAELERDL